MKSQSLRIYHLNQCADESKSNRDKRHEQYLHILIRISNQRTMHNIMEKYSKPSYSSEIFYIEISIDISIARNNISQGTAVNVNITFFV